VCLVLAACGDSEFGPEQVRSVLESAAVKLEGEQVTLSPAQIDCGAREELWTMEQRGDRAVGRLTDRARELNFADDVRIGEAPFPYSQIRGLSNLRVVRVTAIYDEDSGTKVAEARAGVQIRHPCFPTPLPLMGVRKGQFSADTPVRFRFSFDGGWACDRILH
jgi:hypothetical protein